MADDNIFQQYLRPPKSVAEYSAEMDAADTRRNALQQSVMTLQNAADVGRQRNALRDAVTSGQIDLSNPDHINKALTLAPDVAPGLLKTVQDSATSRALAAKDSALAGKTAQETGDLAHTALFKNLGMVNTPEDAQQWALQGLRTHVFTPEQFAAGVQRIPTDPTQLEQWKQQTMAGGQALADQINAPTPKPTEVKLGNRIAFIDMNPRSKSFGQEIAPPQTVGQSPDNVATVGAQIRGQNMAAGTAAAAQNAPQYMQTDAGLVMLPKQMVSGQTPVGTPVLSPDGQAIGPKLKDIPQGANTAILSNMQNLNRAKAALDLLQGKSVGQATGDANATGFKGYAPNGLLNRMDPKGTDTRAAIADLGSMVLHDRSGAAVTAAESPRLMPFIPLATDDRVTAAKKLARFIDVYQQENDAMAETYSKDQGYRPSPVLERNRAQPAPSAPGGNSVRTPDGQTHVFPNAAAAAQFKKAAGL